MNDESYAKALEHRKMLAREQTEAQRFDRLCKIQEADPHAVDPRTPVENVNHPAHYNVGAVECIDAIEAALTPDEFRGYLKGNILKYTWRERTKGGDESMRKAEWYLSRMLRK